MGIHNDLETECHSQNDRTNPAQDQHRDCTEVETLFFAPVGLKRRKLDGIVGLGQF